MQVLRDRFRGCLLAGAAGDALGYPVEFMRCREIVQRYGETGIERYDCSLSARKDTAIITDDTQMTLFTAAGLLEGKRRRGGAVTLDTAWGSMYEAYLDWLYTQRFESKIKRGYTKLTEEPRLYARRAPGNTCVTALSSRKCGSVDEPINHSKGCGGVMRAAPVGLYFGPDAPAADVLMLGAQAAAITHGHPLGYLPAAALAMMVHRAVWVQAETTLASIWESCKAAMLAAFPNEGFLKRFLSLMDDAALLAGNDSPDVKNIAELGEGWVGDEALAIAFYCCLRHEGDIEATLIAAVNHDGDSDSTGAIAGNIAGALLGEARIPAWMLECLELSDVIGAVAEDMLDAIDVG